VIGLQATGGMFAQDSAGDAPAITVYPSYHVKFSREGGNYLLASLVILNISGYTVQNLTLTQVFPEEFTLEPAPADIHAYRQTPQGSEESIEGQTYTMRVPLLRRREVTQGLVVLRYVRRPSEATIAPAKVEYTVSGSARTLDGQALQLPLKKYTKYSGSLSEFIKRYARIQLPIPEGGSSDWGFSDFASRIRAKTEIGLVEIHGDAEEGRFSLLSGAPGETREMLVIWEPISTAKRARTEEEARTLISRQIFSGTDFTMDMEEASMTRTRFGRGEAWVLDSTWKDRVADRLGGGMIRWYVYEDPQRKAQFIMMLRVQGRGVGPDKEKTENPEKERSLMEELEGILKGFRAL
jgi:hypothetical protein